jgi:hypothetical protein
LIAVGTPLKLKQQQAAEGAQLPDLEQVFVELIEQYEGK